ncbi:MAG: hypothetical protein QXO15_10415 [Nitrososphaerota archaeon]
MVETADIVAITLIVGGIIAKCLGYNTVIDSILVAVASFYLGSKIKNGNKTRSS